jgi:hypothetical protein
LLASWVWLRVVIYHPGSIRNLFDQVRDIKATGRVGL